MSGESQLFIYILKKVELLVIFEIEICMFNYGYKLYFVKAIISQIAFVSCVINANVHDIVECVVTFNEKTLS